MSSKNLFTAMLLCSSMAAVAGTFVASESESYDLSEIKKIAFLEDETETIFSDGRVLYHPFSSLQRIYFTENESTDVSDVIPQKELLLYPNPVVEKIYLSGLDGFSSISVISSKGILIKQMESNEEKIEIPVSELTPGIYYLKINDNAIKFIK